MGAGTSQRTDVSELKQQVLQTHNTSFVFVLKAGICLRFLQESKRTKNGRSPASVLKIEPLQVKPTA